ncbi:MAG: hypothetical protein V3U92_12185 [Cellulophaga sp.]
MNSIIDKTKSSLKRKKVKVFLLFLLCSGLAWFVSNLTESYTNTATFDLAYFNVPDSLLLTNVAKKEIEVKLEASGFQFLKFNFFGKKVQINLVALEQNNEHYFISSRVYKNQIENQLPNSIKLLDVVNSGDLSFDLYKLSFKELPVKSMVSLDLGHDYLLDGGLVIAPGVVMVKGPREEIDSLIVLRTEVKVLSGITSKFKEEVELILPGGLPNTTFSKSQVVVSGSVFRFSEKIVKVPVEVVNLPAGMKIKTFPNKVSVLCRAKIDQLQLISSSDFRVVADYNLIKGGKSPIVVLELKKIPENVFSARLQEVEVEYILRRE